ncbi:MAG: S-methyl-5-thioribose-1-phosphate isomerase [Gammaproteobacteria bacterium]|nr:S-methyl-5-thioribose-1-phosphate isomerase [Gammaproteobacteria bacterium]NIR82480.1 S-methyl-5-thioribose-1-phosphate isomerase [Gammaproteobacteria bacterium]NIR88476.1 S-methyl-5-thioribose-1-phosphate isomerase [Gammaproteobacteria bacterium]NIU03616.1 S-methyl-5-thioribose-1-phosphate isomerase [Gammaproteobacteria bacterium]NIV50968.1 S-methyl-5-thioribose-1-phosphate isomerase [Gammaproteobacteria bacterium]
MDTAPHDSIRAVSWSPEGLRLLDQRRLPERAEVLTCGDAAAVAQAIREMVVRGAPAIGIAAAYGVVLAARARYRAAVDSWQRDVEADLDVLGQARPTAVNLAWALARMRIRIASVSGDPEPPLLAEAERIHAEDIEGNRRIGRLGAELIATRCAVLTHCNTGSLATGGYGTALGVIRSAFATGRIDCVYAGETRPWLQGSRLTGWELVQDGIPVRVIADAAASHLMREGKVGWVVVGADRIAANGDVANKIGTYALAVSARQHDVPFMVAAPTSTIDRDLPEGASVPLETRAAEELLCVAGRRVAADGVQVWNPVFDVTPAALIDAIVTERGVVEGPNARKIAALFETRHEPEPFPAK